MSTFTNETPLRLVNVDKDDWVVRARLVRLWEGINHNNDEVMSLDMLLVDAEGTCMHACVRKHLMKRFKLWLDEGAIYVIRNFRVVSLKGEFRPVKRDLMINVMATTTFTGSSHGSSTIVQHYFDFVGFDEIARRCFRHTYLTDVVGRLCAVGGVHDVDVRGSPRKLRTLQLKLNDGKKINANLWGPAAYQVDADVYKNKTGPYVLVITSIFLKPSLGNIH